LKPEVSQRLERSGYNAMRVAVVPNATDGVICHLPFHQKIN